jgi:hypothetical protein
VAVINNLTFEQAGSSFIIEKGGTLEFNGVTNGSISFDPGTNGRLLFDQPGAANSVAAIKGLRPGRRDRRPGQRNGPQLRSQR